VLSSSSFWLAELRHPQMTWCVCESLSIGVGDPRMGACYRWPIPWIKWLACCVWWLMVVDGDGVVVMAVMVR